MDNNNNSNSNPSNNQNVNGGRFFVYTQPVFIINNHHLHPPPPTAPLNNPPQFTNQTNANNIPNNHENLGERERVMGDMERLLMSHLNRMLFDQVTGGGIGLGGGMFQQLFSQQIPLQMFQNFYEQYQQQQQQHQRKGLTKEQMEMLPWLSGRDVSKDHACSICLEMLDKPLKSNQPSISPSAASTSSASSPTAADSKEDKELSEVLSGRLRQMTGCPHVFHEECLFKWLTVSRQCPLCRTDFIDPSDIKDQPESVAVRDDVEEVPDHRHNHQSPIPVDNSPREEFVLEPVTAPKNNNSSNRIIGTEELECGLQQMGCCWDTQNQQNTAVDLTPVSSASNAMARSESHESISSPFVQMHECQHVFHRQCLESSQRIYTALHPSPPQHSSASSVIYRCPMCRSEGRYDMI